MFDREGKRLNERRRKPVEGDLKRWGGGRTGIAGEPFLPREPPMGTLCSGGARRRGGGVPWCGSDRLCGGNGEQNGLGSQELHPLASDLAAWPIAPPNGLGWNRRSAGRG